MAQNELAGIASSRRMILSGAQAMSLAYELAGVRIAYVFPITPQTEVLETMTRSSRVRVIPSDSEFNALASAEGVYWGGERCAIYTSSQGLVLMSEVMWEVAGNRLPMVMGVFNRALRGPAWTLGCQQNDSLFMRDTGWLQFFCETAQDVFDFVLMAMRVAERVCLPALVCGDGFYLSHQKEEVDVPDEAAVRGFVGELAIPDLPDPDRPATYGGVVSTAQQYSKLSERMHRDVVASQDVFFEVAKEFEVLFGRRRTLTEPCEMEDAELVLIASGSTCGAVRTEVLRRRRRGQKVGLLKLSSIRPLPVAELLRHLRPGQKAVVLDRNLNIGAGGIFHGEIAAALRGHLDDLLLLGCITGLGGLDLTPENTGELIDYLAAAGPAQQGLVHFLDEEGLHAAGRTERCN
jgi:pyruvate/2-oxoacid:ferredoxin oxidoreductase alpha subunit